jgi:hypothetical protein
MKTSVLSLFSLILMISIQTVSAKTIIIPEQTDPIEIKSNLNPLAQMKDPCFVTVTVPRSGSAIDCWGNFRIINAIGTCTAHNTSCDLAFQDAYQCARNKASEDYNEKLASMRPGNCAVKTISL